MTTGISFPLRISESGNLEVSTGFELTADRIRSVLKIEPPENPMRPEYGVPNPLFNSVDALNTYAAKVARELERTIPEASFVVNGSVTDGGESLVTVDWKYLGEPQPSILQAIV